LEISGICTRRSKTQNFIS